MIGSRSIDDEIVVRLLLFGIFFVLPGIAHTHLLVLFTGLFFKTPPAASRIPMTCGRVCVCKYENRTRDVLGFFPLITSLVFLVQVSTYIQSE